jgi:hypothetical protein
LLLAVWVSNVQANGGPFGEEKTRGSLLASQPGALAGTDLVAEPDVECLDEELLVLLQPNGARVTIDYTFVNRATAPKRLTYGFPFLVARLDFRLPKDVAATLKMKHQYTRILGEPVGYAISVEGERVPATPREGSAPPRDLSIPEISIKEMPYGAGLEVRPKKKLYWLYQTSALEFPTQKPVRVRVTYFAPYLVRTKAHQDNFASTPGVFTYLLSTGAGWRGGKIGRCRIRIQGQGVSLDRLVVRPKSFKRQGQQLVRDLTDFRPTRQDDIVVRVDANDFSACFDDRSDAESNDRFEIIIQRCHRLNRRGWQIATETQMSSRAPFDGQRPVSYCLAAPNCDGPWVGDYRNLLRSTNRYRVGFFPGDMKSQQAYAAQAQVKKVHIDVVPERKKRYGFDAAVPTLPHAELAAGGPFYLYFDAPGRLEQVTVTVTEVTPGGDGRVHMSPPIIERDARNYYQTMGPISR